MNVLEAFFLELGLGWTFSKLLIFFIILFVSIGLALFQRRWRTSIKWLFWLRIVSVSALPVTVYFIINPIYAGDILDDSETVESELKFSNEKTLNIIVLRNCPHCKKTIEFTDMLLKRNPDINIKYYVLGSESGDIGFLNKIHRKCKATQYVQDVKKVNELTKGNYPTFILSENKNAKIRWSNDHFGFRSLDIIENFLLE